MSDPKESNFFYDIAAALGLDYYNLGDPVLAYLDSADSQFIAASGAMTGGAVERVQAAQQYQKQADAWSKVSKDVASSAPENRIVQNQSKIMQQVAASHQQAANSFMESAQSLSNSALAKKAAAEAFRATAIGLGVALAVGQIVKAGQEGGGAGDWRESIRDSG